MECTSSVTQIQRVLKSKQILGDAEKSLPVLLPIFERNVDDHRRLIYFLWLNSDHGFSDQLSNEFSVGLLINRVPTVETTWTIKLSLLVGAEKFLLEAVEYGPEGLANQLARSILTCVDAEEHWEFYRQLAEILLGRLVESNESNTVSQTSVTCLSDTLKKLAKVCYNSLQTVNHERSGNVVLSFLELLLLAIQFELRNVDPELKELYALKEKYRSRNDTIVEFSFEQNLNLFFAALEGVLKCISFDVWISWADNLIQDEETCLQTLFGNLVFKICESIEELEISVPNEIWQCLNHLKISPLSTEELIEKSSFNNLLKVVEEEQMEEMEKWYEALLNSENAWQDLQSLAVILSKINLARHPDKVLEKYVSLIRKEETFHLPKYLEALKKLDTTYQLKLLKIISQTNEIWRFHPSASSSIGINVSLDNIIEEFNKLSSTTSVDDFLKIIFPSLILQPFEVIHKIFEFAISIGDNSVCVELLNVCKDVLSATGFKATGREAIIHEQRLLEYASEELFFRDLFSDKQFIALIQFFASLRKANVLPKAFMGAFLLPALEYGVRHAHYPLCCRLFQLFECISFELCEDEVSLVPLLVFLAHLLSETCWDAEKFERNKVELNDMVAKTVSKLLLEHMPQLTDLDLKFLRSVIGTFPEEVKTHFFSIWLCDHEELPNKPAGDVETFEMLLTSIRTDLKAGYSLNFDPEKPQFFFSLAQILPVIHPWEWVPLEKMCKKIVNPDENKDSPEHTVAAFGMIAKALCVLAACLNSNLTHVFERCLKHFSCLLDSHLPSLHENNLFKLFYYFLLPLSRVNDVCFRCQLFLRNIPIIGIVYSQCLCFCPDRKLVDDVESMLCVMDGLWKDKMQDYVDLVVSQSRDLARLV